MFSLNITNWAIELTRGDSARFAIDVKNVTRDESGKANKEEYQIKDNDILTFSVKRKAKDEEQLLIQKKFMANNIVYIAPQDTRDLQVGSYVYDVQLTTGAGDVYTLTPLNPPMFKLYPEVTNG